MCNKIAGSGLCGLMLQGVVFVKDITECLVRRLDTYQDQAVLAPAPDRQACYGSYGQPIDGVLVRKRRRIYSAARDRDNKLQNERYGLKDRKN